MKQIAAVAPEPASISYNKSRVNAHCLKYSDLGFGLFKQFFRSHHLPLAEDNYYIGSLNEASARLYSK